jgi:hypothetical protein
VRTKQEITALSHPRPKLSSKPIAFEPDLQQGFERENTLLSPSGMDPFAYPCLRKGNCSYQLAQRAVLNKSSGDPSKATPCLTRNNAKACLRAFAEKEAERPQETPDAALRAMETSWVSCPMQSQRRGMTPENGPFREVLMMPPLRVQVCTPALLHS